MADILTSLHGSKIGVGSNNELIVQGDDGSGEVVARASSELGATVNSVTGLAGVHGALTRDSLILTLTNVTVALTDEAGVVAYLGQKIADIPAGVYSACAHVNLTITKSSAGVNDDWDSDIGIGTATASNNATLSSTKQNILSTTAVTQATSGSTTVIAGNASPTVFTDSAAKSVYLNFLVDDADHDVTSTACNMIFNGTIILETIKYDASF